MIAIVNSNSKEKVTEAPSGIILRIPKDLISTWIELKRALAKEYPDLKEGKDSISDPVAFRTILVDYARRDYFLLASNIEKLFPILSRIESKIGAVSSQLIRHNLRGKTESESK